MVLKEKGKFNPSPKEKEKPLNMEIEDKKNLTFLPGAILVLYFHKIGHTTDSCRRRLALHNNTLYQQLGANIVLGNSYYLLV
jgi:hypothetical protein